MQNNSCWANLVSWLDNKFLLKGLIEEYIYILKNTWLSFTHFHLKKKKSKHIPKNTSKILSSKIIE